MTAALPFTEASVRRRIAAAQKQGLQVIGIAADGTVLTGEKLVESVHNHAVASDTPQQSLKDQWGDVEA